MSFLVLELSHSSVLAEVLSVLRRYQTLVPTLLAQAHISVTKLLTEVVTVSKGNEKTEPADWNYFSVLTNALTIILEAPVELLQNIVKVRYSACKVR